MSLKVTTGLKEIGGVSIPVWAKILVIKGSHFKIGALFEDQNGVAYTITTFTIKLRLKKQDNTIVEITHSPVDNTKGETEFSVDPTISSLLLAGVDQTIEFEIFKTATPTTTAFYKVEKAISVYAQSLV